MDLPNRLTSILDNLVGGFVLPALGLGRKMTMAGRSKPVGYSSGGNRKINNWEAILPGRRSVALV